MFILTREIDQKLIIGDNIEVVVLDIEDDQVKIGVEMPKDMGIIRDDIAVQNSSASND